jgi:two-component system chemotaxis response regulator CheV
MGTSHVRTDILLDAGTNELEVLVFTVGGTHFGVNVAKVREVIRAQPLTRSPDMPETVDGMFNMRGQIISVVDLRKHLRIASKGDAAAERWIVTEFNGLRTGFRVDSVDQIHRLSWSLVKPAPDVDSIAEGGYSTCTGVIDLKGNLVLMLDFESIADSILMQKKLLVEHVENELGVDRASKRVIMCEDSPFIRSRILQALRVAGYANSTVVSDGQAAWELLEQAAARGERVDAVVSDIEMPRMDGLHLTRRIKESPQLRSTPVILFSSLISADNRKKGEQVGADLQIAKPELAEMVKLIDRAVSGNLVQQNSVRAAA